MADFKLIGTVYPNAASDTSLTSIWTVPAEFTHFSCYLPASMLVTCTGQVQVYGGRSATDTFKEIVYSQNPATATSGNALAGEMSTSSVASGALVINEAIQFSPYIRFRFTNTCTCNTGIYVYGRKFD